MDLTERQALTNCWIFFKENVCDVNSILDYFIQAGVNCEDVEEITVEPTRSKRKQAFLMRVPKWGSDAFRVLVKALNNTGCNHVSDRLMEELECVRQKCLCTRNTSKFLTLLEYLSEMDSVGHCYICLRDTVVSEIQAVWVKHDDDELF